MSINTSTAITVGYLWVVGSALVAMAVPAGLTALVVRNTDVMLPGSGVAAIVFFLAQAVAAITCMIVAYAVMLPLWRLWAYRRVPNVSLLKKRAEEVRLVYSARSFLGRIEWTSHRTREEIQRLEWAGGTGGAERITGLGSFLRSIQYGAVVGLCAALPASLLLNVSDENTVVTWIFGISALVEALTAGLIYLKARRSKISAEEAFKSFIPSVIRRQD